MACVPPRIFMNQVLIHRLKLANVTIRRMYCTVQQYGAVSERMICAQLVQAAGKGYVLAFCVRRRIFFSYYMNVRIPAYSIRAAPVVERLVVGKFVSKRKTQRWRRQQLLSGTGETPPQWYRRNDAHFDMFHASLGRQGNKHTPTSLYSSVSSSTVCDFVQRHDYTVQYANSEIVSM